MSNKKIIVDDVQHPILQRAVLPRTRSWKAVGVVSSTGKKKEATKEGKKPPVKRTILVDEEEDTKVNAPIPKETVYDAVPTAQGPPVLYLPAPPLNEETVQP